MSKATNKIGTGVKAVGTGLKMVSGTDVPAYTLEFLTKSEKHPQNTSQTIVVPYVELGRDGNCVVTFGKDTPMVSKKHAAIERRGPETVLKQLSQTNQTFINGRPVVKEWFLTNGDEIQLSANGPRIRYLTTAAKTSTIGLSKRIQLFAQQSLRPYRRALITLLVLFLAGAAASAYLIVTLRTDNQRLQSAYKEINQQTSAQQAAIKKGDSLFLAAQKETANKLATANQENTSLKQDLSVLKQALEKSNKTPPPVRVQPVAVPASSGTLLPKMIEQVSRHVYFLKMYLTIAGESDRTFVGSGTGFLLSDGRFITARHCVQPWAYVNLEAQKEADQRWLLVNWLYYNRPKGTIKLELELTSPENKTIVLPAEKFTVRDGQDLYYTDIDVGLGPGKVQLASPEDGTDWAFCSVDTKSLIGVPADPVGCSQLKSGTVLHVLGYTFGLGNSGEAPSPFYSTAHVSQTGLVGGLINVTNLSAAQGNSGGPVFVEKDGQLVNVGLVSATNSDAGMVVPISALK